MTIVLLKNIKIIRPFIIILFFHLYFSANGQTRNETIKWINTNGVSLSEIEDRNHFSLYFSITKVDKDSIYYVYNDNTLKPDQKRSIPLKGILYEDISTIEVKTDPNNRSIKAYAIKVLITSREKNKNGRYKKVDNITDFIFPYEDKDKANRVVKAIMDLAKLRGARENKQFY